MKIRTVYFKVLEMTPAVAFWQALLQLPPVKQSSHWSEFKLGEVRLGLLLNDFDESVSGAACVPVLECADSEIGALIERAKSLGAMVVVDGLDNPKMKSVVLATSFGSEFELCCCHD
jgi:hypothetical protein